ncbi:MAG: bacteriophage abortive infection AbiH family protein [Treponema sp.]|nr:bacteriophage abortive infection AbiH family protein [Treponema sp.]
MNRLLLIGNGFDLAHDYKTSYIDFINDLWEQKANALINKYLLENESAEKKGTQPIYFDYNDDEISLIDIPFYNNNIPDEVLKKKDKKKLIIF